MTNRYSVLHGVTVTRSNQSVIVTVNAEGPVHVTSGRVAAPDRIFVDLIGARYTGRVLRIPVAGGNVLQIRVSQVQATPAIARIVLDVARPLPFEIVSYRDGFAIQVNTGPENPSEAEHTVPTAPPPPGAGLPATNVTPETPVSAPPSPSPDAADTNINPQLDVGQLHSLLSRFNPFELSPTAPPPSEHSDDEEGPTTAHQAAKANLPVLIRGVTISRQNGGIDVHIEANGRLRPTAHEFSNPDRIIVDLPNAYCEHERRIPVHRADVKDVDVSLYLLNPPVTRIVLTLTGPHTYRLLGSDNSLIIRVGAREPGRTQSHSIANPSDEAPVTLLREPPTR